MALLVLLSGCLGSAETVTVTQRPETIPSTEDVENEVERPIVAMPAGYDTVQAQRFDQGKMWTFESPPMAYFQDRYDFAADSSWFRRARLGALRFGSSCSASFVSPNGLIMTNHHCARESIVKVSQEDENLLDNGFYAAGLTAERRVPDLYVEQLIGIENVTERVYAGPDTQVDRGVTSAQARQRRAQQLQEQLTAEAKERDEDLRVQVVALYSGSQYSAYTFRRFDDVRLVIAPQLELGFFGGSPDNFTYPRFALDMTFFRAYNDEGTPLQTEHYFPWSTEGVQEGDAVFVVGNPASTSRLNTVSQLQFDRDYTLQQQLNALQRRADIVKPYIEQHPEQVDQYDLRNLSFALDNSLKSTRGQLRGLYDPYLMARRAAAERKLQQTILSADSLQQDYGDIIQRIELLQQAKQSTARKQAAFTFFTSSQLGSRILTRGVYGYYYAQLKGRVPEEQLAEIRKNALAIDNWPVGLEESFIAARLREMRDALGENDPTVQRVLSGTTPEQLAQRLAQNSALIDSTGFAKLLGNGYLNSDDPSVPVIQAIAPLYFTVIRQMQDYQATEEALNAQLAQARFAAFGYAIPPDATFTPRISDGVVKSYPYNGTRAPAFTNFYGLFDHYHSYRHPDWDLPEAWLSPPAAFDLGTPLNLVSTNDITGGNSGSPLLNKELEVVGLIFDSNIQALPSEFLYTTQAARAISVDARGILETLRDFYDADRIAVELTTGRLFPTEERADAATSTP